MFYNSAKPVRKGVECKEQHSSKGSSDENLPFPAFKCYNRVLGASTNSENLKNMTVSLF